jgi:hypothetical protein
MNISQILELQKYQYFHDMNYHQDVIFLGTQERIKHLILHFIKYIAKLNAVQTHNKSQIICDLFICCLSFANLLEIKLISIDFTPPQSDETGALLNILGKMAKAAEALDHVELYPSREVLEEQLIKLGSNTLYIGNKYKVDLFLLIQSRWKEIEDKKNSLRHKPEYSKNMSNL